MSYFNPRSREGSDCRRDKMRVISQISIHAPARGATLTAYSNCLFDTISIHAPARGATPSAVSDLSQLANFNPRSREGSDYGQT